MINLSVKSKDVEDDKQALENVRSKAAESSGATTIGDLIKEQMQQQNANKD